MIFVYFERMMLILKNEHVFDGLRLIQNNIFASEVNITAPKLDKNCI